MENWFSQHQTLVVIICTLITSVVTGLCTWLLTRNSQSSTNNLLTEQLGQIKQERESLKKKNQEANERLRTTELRVNDLQTIAKKYEEIRANLQGSAVVRTYRQPVLLVGPRLVGKTSLLMQWHAPWVISRLDRTQTHKTGDVPVYDYIEKNKEPHFAAPDLLVPAHSHLVLKVHDFPGEEKAQKLIRNIAIEETQNLQKQSKSNLGIVLICMFDAEEAAIGISKETKQYYNGELFRELRALVTHSQIHLERLILVFNKYDGLRAHFKEDVDDKELIRLCVEKFDPTYDLLHNVCNPEKVCEVFTVLSREEMHLKNRGAPIILGEAARAFVRTFAGREAEAKIIEQPATTYAAEKFL